MNFQTLALSISLISIYATLGCASKSGVAVPVEAQNPKTSYTEKAEGQAITTAAAIKVKAKSFIEIEFNEGSSTLTNQVQVELSDFIKNSYQSDSIREIIILSWSDNEYPSKTAKKLSEGQIDLAEKRNKEIRKFVREIQNAPTSIFNMAQQPTVIANFFNTKDSKLKNSLVKAGLPTTADELQYPSKARHSIVMIRVE